MAINISLEGSKIGGKVTIGKEATIPESTGIDINLKKAEIQKGVDLLSKAKIIEVINTAEKGLSTDSKEFQALEKIKNDKAADSKSVRNAVLNHIASFAGGTLANVLAGYILKL